MVRRRFAKTVGDLTAMILCGGEGRRLSNTVPDTPKFLAPLADRPYADWILTMIAAEGVRDVVLCTGAMGERVQSYCSDGSHWGLEVRYSRDPWPLGTGGAVRQALQLSTSDPVVVLNGDTLIRLQLAALLAMHRDHGAVGTILVTLEEDCSGFGSVQMGDANNVARFGEKERHGPGHVSAGVYMLTPSALDFLAAGTRASLEHDVLPTLTDGRLYALVGTGPFVDIGTPASYRRAQDLALKDLLFGAAKRSR